MISIIAAAAKNRVIGSNGKIPWDIPEDKAYFSRLTTGNVIIMGRRTYEEIGFALPNRYNIVVSKTLELSGDNICTAKSLEQAINIAQEHISESDAEHIFLCGGEKIYEQGLRLAQRIYLTELDDEYDGDAFFPEFDTEQFKLVQSIRSQREKLRYCIYERS